jgi:hypothetical protein
MNTSTSIQLKKEQKFAIETSAHNVKDMIPLEEYFLLFVPKNILQNEKNSIMSYDRMIVV